MSGNYVSETGKKASEKMTNAALLEAKGWAEKLMNLEFKGRGDKEKTARFRLSKKIGVPESYLFRLQYKTRGMKDVAGSVYRALMIAYDRACKSNEEAADRYRAERLSMDEDHEAAGKERATAHGGISAASLEADQAKVEA